MPAADESLSRNRQARARLEEVIANLRQVQAVIPVAVAALRHQNADIDADVAVLLQRAVGAKLGEQIDKLESMRELLASPAGSKI